jgi:hypothetical protein
MEKYRDPAWTVQRAWSSLRLPALQAIVNETITELGRLEPRELLGRELSNQDPQLESNAVAEAFTACSEELRNEAGMIDSDARRASHCKLVRAYKAHESADWSTTFEEALGKYRRAAGESLQVSLPASPEAF